MKSRIINFLFIFVILFYPKQVNAENDLNFYMDDFYKKSSEARLLIKEIESEMKLGIRNRVCPRQIKAAKLGILANESLIKAFKIAGIKPPISSINASQKRWKSLLNDCKNIN